MTLVSIDVSKLDDDYLRVYAGKDEIVNNDTLKFAINGYGIGSFNYGRTEPLRPYVYTLLPDGTTISTTDEERMNHVIEQARNIFYDTETGWAIPINQRENGTAPGTRSGSWLMRQIPKQGYWNGGYMIIGETNLLEGGEAQIDAPVSPGAAYEEITGPWIRDGPNGSNNYSCTIDDNGTPDNFNDDIYTLTTLGKAHITITTDFPAGSGKE